MFKEPCLVFYDKITGKILHTHICYRVNKKSKKRTAEMMLPVDAEEVKNEISAADGEIIKKTTDQDASNIAYKYFEEDFHLWENRIDISSKELVQKPKLVLEIDTKKTEIKKNEDGINTIPGDGETIVNFKCFLVDKDGNKIKKYPSSDNIKLKFSDGRPVVVKKEFNTSGNILFKIKAPINYVEKATFRAFCENEMCLVSEIVKICFE